jgi:hypothetical protein
LHGSWSLCRNQRFLSNFHGFSLCSADNKALFHWDIVPSITNFHQIVKKLHMSTSVETRFQMHNYSNFIRFILNGLTNANTILGENAFDIKDWKVVGEYVFDHEGGRHQAFYIPKTDVQYKNILLKAGERIQVEQSLKYSPKEAIHLWQISGLREVTHWTASSDAYSTYRFISTVWFILQLYLQAVIMHV